MFDAMRNQLNRGSAATTPPLETRTLLTGLTTYSDPDFAGTSYSDYEPDVIYTATGAKKSELLPVADKDIESIAIESGYMVTLAENEDGTGTRLLKINNTPQLLQIDLPDYMRNKFSFIRVTPWKGDTKKKGYAGGGGHAVDASWTYNWNSNGTSKAQREYVPMRHNEGWAKIRKDKRGVTHYLAYNEPDSSDKKQANMYVSEAIDHYPNIAATGYRLGSPATTDAGANWLYKFVSRADRADLPIDVTAVHFYRGNQSAEQFLTYLKNIYNRTGRPIWVTEFNNGANWTGKASIPKTPGDQQWKINQFQKMLEDAYFVERYAIYNYVGKSRQLVKGKGKLTPAGESYKKRESNYAYQETPYVRIKNTETGGYLRPLNEEPHSPLVTSSVADEWTEWMKIEDGKFFYLMNKKTGQFFGVYLNAQGEEVVSTSEHTEAYAAARWVDHAIGKSSFRLRSSHKGLALRAGDKTLEQAAPGSDEAYTTTLDFKNSNGDSTRWKFEYIDFSANASAVDFSKVVQEEDDTESNETERESAAFSEDGSVTESKGRDLSSELAGDPEGSQAGSPLGFDGAGFEDDDILVD